MSLVWPAGAPFRLSCGSGMKGSAGGEAWEDLVASSHACPSIIHPSPCQQGRGWEELSCSSSSRPLLVPA